MKWLRLLVLLVVVVAVGAAILLRERLLAGAAEVVRALAEREVAAALDTPLAIRTLRLVLVPPGFEAEGLALGPDGTIAQVARVSAQLRTRTSLRQRRPVLDVQVDAVRLDLPRLLAALPEDVDAEPVVLPAFRLRRVTVRDVAVRVTDAPDALHLQTAAVVGQVSADGAAGGLRFGASAMAPVLERAGRRLTLTQAEVRGRETARGWRLTAAALDGDGIALRGTPRDAALALDGHLELAQLAFLDETLASLRGRATFSGTLDGPLDAASVQLTLRVPDLALADQALGDVEATATLDAEHLELASARLRGFGGEIEASGTLTLDEALSYLGQTRWRGIDVRQAAAAGAIEAPALTADGALELTGTLDPPRLEGRGEGRLAPPAPGGAIAWRGGGSYAAGAGSVDVALRQGGGNRADVQATLGAAGELGGTLRVEVADPDGLRGVLPIASLPNVRGAASASARLGGTLEDPTLDGELTARDVALAEARIDRARGRFRLDRRALRTDGIALAIGGGTADLRGTVAIDATTDNAWTLRAAGIDGAAVAALARGLGGVALPIAGGTFRAAATASGPWPRLRVDGDLALEDFWLGRERVARAAVTVRATGGRWVADASIRNRPEQQLAWRAEGEIGGAIAVEGGGEWQLTSLQQGEQAEMGGVLHLAASLRGRPAALDGSVELRAADLVLAGRPIGAVQVTARATRGRWRADAVLLDGAFTAQAEVRPDAGMPFVLDGVWREANLAHLISDQLAARLESSGTLRASGRLTALDAAEIDVAVSSLRLVEGGEAVVNDGPLTLRCRRGVCTLAPVTMRGASGSLTASGEMHFDGRVRLVVAGGGSLEILELAGDPIQSATGRFTVDALVTRDAAGLRVGGNLALEGAGLDLGLPVALTRTTGRLTFDGNRVRVEELGGRVGTGTFRITGAIDLNQGPELGWELIQVGAVPLPSLEMEVSGKGTLDGSWESLRLAGELLVHRMLYDRDINLTDLLPSFNRALAAAPRAADEGDVRLELHVRAPAQLFVENNLARIEGRADLRLSGTMARPVIAGRVEALDGEITFRGRQFDLEGATADFRPDLGMVAALNVAAESLIDTPDATYTVGVRVTGTTANPRIVLTSDDPGLTQTDIATLIAVGRTSSQLRAGGGGGGFSAFDALSFMPLTSRVEGEATRFLPIDRIEFETVYSRTTGSFEPQIKIGKDLTDNLAVSIGQTFGVSSRTLVEADYRLGPRVSIPVSWESQTETDAGAFGAGVRVRYEFWRVTPFTLLSGLH